MTGEVGVAVADLSLVAKEQVRHLVGMAALMDWCARWRDVEGAVVQDKDVLTLGSEPSARFALALPASRRAVPVPTLLIQPDETEWLGLISWSRVHIGEAGLSLVAKRFVGVGNLPDLASFAVTIQLAGEARQLPFHNPRVGHLEVRRFWLDEGQWQIEGGRRFRQLRISPKGSPLFTGQDLVVGETFLDKVRKHSASLSSAMPRFEGKAPDLTHLSDDFLLHTSTVPTLPPA